MKSRKFIILMSVTAAAVIFVAASLAYMYFQNRSAEEQRAQLLAEREITAEESVTPAAPEISVAVKTPEPTETPEVTESVFYPIGQKVLSINPLNWKTDSTPADKSLNKGSRLLNGRGEVKREATELCGAYIDPDRGVLKVTDIDAADYKPVIPIFTPGVLHVYDSQLFYQNLKDNAELRLQNYLTEHDLNR